ncbi:hypothetical protein BCU70_15270 [Vibrio sp. 10N.286.49.C2]|uniref:phosphotransferase n=1 Tax=unclassified Vibrio TaxID=2614977 RepID=UPI000C8339C6|nr:MULTISPECIES: phosphotransferase [unclassified Vibrio]PMH37779.1 hypothetical protein BCU70_15270 [Vibrio sp. 10N.286.49.C2]PMH45056.1 hypothetical protein BCU66_01730 [Vibrio sp. 10N.286.49.B1]PMH83195.1 hypothetical protein BCU58_15640 [Vibrio sp. 10N.286.48.B7]
MIDWQHALQQQPELLHAQTVLNEVPLGALQLSGGLTNRTWKIATQTRGWVVWRGHTEISAAFDICRDNEKAVLNLVSPYIKTNQVLGYSEHGVLLAWVEGSPVSEALSAQDVIALLVRVHACHYHTEAIRRFDYTQKVDHYWQQIKECEEKSRYSTLYQKLRLPPSLMSHPSALCHFDFGHHNLVNTSTLSGGGIICDDNAIAVIDWEYAAIADPRLDLVLTLDMLGMNHEEGLELYMREQRRLIRNTRQQRSQALDLQAHDLQAPDLQRLDLQDLDLQERCFQDSSFQAQWRHDMRVWSDHAQMMALLWYVLAAQLWNNDDFLFNAEHIYRRLCRSDHCLSFLSD